MSTGFGGESCEEHLAGLRDLRRRIDGLELLFAIRSAEFAAGPSFSTRTPTARWR